MKYLVSLWIFFLLVSCAPAAIAPTALPIATATLRPISTPIPTRTPYPTPTRAPTWTPEASATPAGLLISQSAYGPYTIAALRTRVYGGGTLENLGAKGADKNFSRYLFRYPSDGLNIDGFVNIPTGKGPFPVIIVLHGYADPASYKTLDYTTDAADELTRQGYIVVHPNYRNFPTSDSGDSLFRVGYAVDVLNLIGQIRKNTGKPGFFEKAKADRIGIWAHSMGGDIALRVAVISPYIKAILLYAPMSGDTHKNSLFFDKIAPSSETKRELQASDQDFAEISPMNYFSDITAAIQVHHGDNDSVIPVEWSIETCKLLRDFNRQVECYYYKNAEHTFLSRYSKEMAPRMNGFFENYLKQ